MFLLDSLLILFLLFQNKDSFLLIYWIKIIFTKINFFKYKLFFYYLKYVIFFFFLYKFKRFRIYGLKFLIKGKLCVIGNARKRNFWIVFGKISNFTILYKINYHLILINTFTGVLGLKI